MSAHQGAQGSAAGYLAAARTGALLSKARERASAWEPAAWGAIAVTGLFIGITCWWLTQDHSIPVFDAGVHLVLVHLVHRELNAGHLVKALTISSPYPPFSYLIGALGITIGGSSVAAPIIAENLFFGSLLALGCYQVGKRAFSPLAGLLAVVFALGSPLAIAQFHVFMTDVPETAMVAVSIWLIMATEGFSRTWVSALAGLAVGLGMLTKEPLALFVAGVILVTVVRLFIGGFSKGWRGLLAFTLIALAISLPWYIGEYASVHQLVNIGVLSTPKGVLPADIEPGRFGFDNFTWYFWNFINAQLLAPLFAFAAIGWIWMTTRVVRRQPIGAATPEIMVGAFIGWLAITETFVHDTRYSEPMLVYLAVIGTGWIVHVNRRVRIAAVAVLAIIAAANTLGVTFGVGSPITLFEGNTSTLQQRGRVELYANSGFLVGAPHRDGDILATFRSMQRHGVTQVAISTSFYSEPDFYGEGVAALAELAGLNTIAAEPATADEHTAFLVHTKIKAGTPPPCVRLDDGTGVWVVLGDPDAPDARYYCPSHHPSFYGHP
jgi:Dolichyl-phosphate-mannose-protein mannosyltransferase